ncbi:DUF2785 domain-containing protein [Paenibacillus tianjinensis]|uniref:DUF2785 domain-containing protein n=1 Tax=Paenibacillus tianjinensis TaxID=2810347 RepID=A0ABX7LFQ4_9BACL|nr:DUF2785 domain-containing protein [Paenibacillus tianjinensis]QSF46947.1 DUF2785 domain-containing protein [Paenibacillus tianjinensis]
MSDSRSRLIVDLQRIEAEEYQLRDGEAYTDFIHLMLEYIGDPQPELRDELIYPTFYQWILKKRLFTAEELRSFLNVLLDEQHLFYEIGSTEDDSVFTRTFSVLPVALIMQLHIKQPFLSAEEYRALKDALLRYYREEKDLRGYVEDGGWAHAAAHGADALDELVQCPESGEEVQLEVLEAIKDMLQNRMFLFVEEEDERMATVVDTMIVQGRLPWNSISGWIGSLGDCKDWPPGRSQRIAQVNSKSFLRSLYFRRGRQDRSEAFKQVLLAAEASLNRFC